MFLRACAPLLALAASSLFLLLGSAHARDDLYTGRTSVVRVNKYNFASKTSGPNLPLLLEFYSPGCGHCRQLEPVWQTLAERTEGHVQVGATNCQDPLDDLCSRYQIQGVPAIKLFLRNDVGESYFADYPPGQARSLNDILAWVVERLPNALLKVSETKSGGKIIRLEEFVQRDPGKPHVLLVKKEGWLASMPAKTLSMQFKDNLVMGILDGAVDGAALRERFALDQSFAKDADTLLILCNGEAEAYRGPLKFTELKSFLGKLARERPSTSTTTDRRTEL